MQFSTLKEIADSINMEAKELLADIKAVFGDEFPQVRDWKQNTKLPDDTITYRIMEYYGIKADIEKNNLPAQVPTCKKLQTRTLQTANKAKLKPH